MSETSRLARVEAQRKWGRARQAAGIQRILTYFTPHTNELIPFDEVKRRLHLNHKNYRGLQDIPLDQIRGSVGRYQDFTATFLPKRDSLRERWERVSAVTFDSGTPPIDVYKVGDAYFVLDGNHRVSIARQNQQGTIQANVWEFATPVGLSSHADLDELLIKTEYANFLERTKLDQLRPEQKIEFTVPGRYPELEYQIALYRRTLELIDEEPISYEDAVTAWYDMVYTPAIQIIKERGILDRFPGRTEADLFIWTWRYRQELEAEGKPKNLAGAAEALPPEGLFERIGWWAGRVLGRRNK